MRAAALKGKNPNDIVAELEKIDDMEFNVLMPPPLNGKVRQFAIHVQKWLQTLKSPLPRFRSCQRSGASCTRRGTA